MKTSSRARLGAFALAAAVVSLLASCKDSRIRKLDEGISKDSALKVLAQGAPPGDSLLNVYKHTRYLVGGAMYDIYFFDPKNRKVWVDKNVPDKELTPVIMVDGKVDGWGWGDMDDITEKVHIQARTPEQNR